MFKKSFMAAAVLGTVLSAGAVMNTGIANAGPYGCAPGYPCPPGGGMPPPGPPPGGGGYPPQPPPPGGWPHHHHHWDDPGVGFGIYLGDGYGDGYDGGYYGGYPRYIGCGQAKSIVRSHGFYNVRTESCQPGDYTFLGIKHGEPFEIEVSGRGRIISVDPAY